MKRVDLKTIDILGLRNKMPHFTTFPIRESTSSSNYFVIKLKCFANNQKCLRNLYAYRIEIIFVEHLITSYDQIKIRAHC